MISKRELLACVLGGILLAISDRSFAVDDECPITSSSIHFAVTDGHR